MSFETGGTGDAVSAKSFGRAVSSKVSQRNQNTLNQKNLNQSYEDD